MHIDRIKKFCLTVKENPWRNAEVQDRFEKAGLEVEMFYGIHGQTVGIMPTTTVWDVEREHTYRNNPGKTSITISKLLIFQHILDLNYDEVIIFENDVKFCGNFREEFERSYTALPADWQVVHIGHCCTEGKPQVPVNDRITQIAGPLCCHAILWKREAIELAVKEIKRAYWGSNSDIIFQKKVYPNLVHYSFVPPLAFQDGTDSEAAKMEVYTDVQGWTTPDIIRIYDEQLTGFGEAKCKIAEVGTWKGRSAIYMASEIKRRLKNVTFYCVDTWEGNADEPDMQELIKEANARGGLYQEFIRNINRCGVADYIIPLRMPSVEAAKQFKDGELAFVYIDAGHSYEDVLADLRAWYRVTHYNSVIAGHDIAKDGVRRAVKDFCQEVGKKYRTYQESWIIDHCHIRDF